MMQTFLETPVAGTPADSDVAGYGKDPQLWEPGPVEYFLGHALCSDTIIFQSYAVGRIGESGQEQLTAVFGTEAFAKLAVSNAWGPYAACRLADRFHSPTVRALCEWTAWFVSAHPDAENCKVRP